MNRISQFSKLIWDFYREDRSELTRLKSLEGCKVFRRWGVLYVRCWSLEVAQTLTAAHTLLREPVARLRLARRIDILFEDRSIATFDVRSNQRIA